MLFKLKIWCRDPDSLILHHQDNKRMKRTLEEEQKARKELEKIVRKVLKSMNDPSWDETNLWAHLYILKTASELSCELCWV